MVKKSTKSKPKRVTLGEKYARIRKAKQKQVKEKRKAKKEAKQRMLQGGKKPKMKDPGVPSSWPFKEEFLKEMAFEKARIMAKKQKEKADRLAKRVVDQGGDSIEENLTPMEALKAQADQRQEEFGSIDPTESSVTTNQGRIDRSFYKEFKKVVELADVVIEVLDARDPLPCRSLEVENFVRQCGAQKRIILLLNKIDLAPKESVEKWLKYLREEMPTIAFKSSTQKQHKHLGQAKKMGLGQKSSTQMCLGAENLLQVLKNYARNKSIKTAITVGIVGMPNVGKSSVINSLKRTRVAHVGNRPGVTTSIQEVNLDKQIRLLDSPGIVVSKSQGPLMGCMKTEKLIDPIGVIDEVLRRVSPEKLSTIYNVQQFQTADEFLEVLASTRGKLKRGGVPDKESVAKNVLQDWNAGFIPYHTTPPERPRGKSISLVKEWADDFDINEISDAQLLSSVQSLNDLESSTLNALSNLDVAGVADPHIDTAIESIDGVTLADKGYADEDNDKNTSYKRKNQPESLTFEGADAGFSQMAKRTNDRKDLGNAARELAGLCVEGEDKDILELNTNQSKKEHEEESSHKQKKKKVGAGSAPKIPEIPKPKGLIMAEDGEGDDNDNEFTIDQASNKKRKKPAKGSSEAQLYGNEGQLNPHRLRADRKRIKKAKRRKQKIAEEANIVASNLADAVLGAVNLGGDME